MRVQLHQLGIYEVNVKAPLNRFYVDDYYYYRNNFSWISHSALGIL